MKHNFLPLTAVEFNTIKEELASESLAFGSEFNGLSEDAEWQIRYNLCNKFSGTDSFASVARFISKEDYATYIKKVA